MLLFRITSILNEDQRTIIGPLDFDTIRLGVRVRVMVFNATFNNISVVSLRSVLLVEETGVPGESHRPDPPKSQINFII